MTAKTLTTVTPAEPEAEAIYRIPAHGHGRLRPFQPGQSGNPGGKQGRYHEVVRMAREASPEVMQRLIDLALDRNEDARVSVLAAQEVLSRAYGRIRAEVKISDDGAATLDASKLTDHELEILMKLSAKGRDALQ